MIARPVDAVGAHWFCYADLADMLARFGRAVAVVAANVARHGFDPARTLWTATAEPDGIVVRVHYVELGQA